MILTKPNKPKVLKTIKTFKQQKKQVSRRDFFQTILLPRTYTKDLNYEFLGPSDKGIEPYTGAWTVQQAAHLLRRTTFGPTYQQMKDAVTDGLDATINLLFSTPVAPGVPINFYYADDPNVPVGQTWLDKPFIDGIEIEQYEYRYRSIRSWQCAKMIEEGVNINEKMTLFWHNHFVTSDIDEPNALYRYIKLLRENAVGNFKQLTKDISIDAAMLFYLNGNENIVDEPNENYARELLELFTIGKGPLIGAGDYTNYTEQDVEALAKIFTGWQVENDWSYTLGESLEVNFYNDIHDTSTKTLSAHFNNATIANNGADEYKDVIDVIFQQDEVARFLVRKLYRWFVYYDINETVELKVIEPLAQILRNNNYEVQPVLETLLKSEHFFDMLSMGCVIKNPIDFSLTAIKQLGAIIPTGLEERNRWLETVFYFSAEFGMEYFLPPSVAGWKAYYQSPGYYRLWMNPVTFEFRKQVTGGLIYGYEYDGLNYEINPIDFLQSIDNPANPNEVITEFTRILLPIPLSANQKTFLKGVLIPGLPDFEWTTEYNNYLSNPNDENIKLSLEAKLKNLLYMISVLPEYHLS
ncbi:MAG TPA: DUF1800 domain-containing protein [Saprospiraceae bacterium]|nr:DUF1800 domain-containing protein [Saprospiraceae bacterium]